MPFTPKRTVQFIPDPADPSATPRAVVVEKVGFWDRLIPPPAIASRPLPVPVPVTAPTPTTATPTTPLPTPPQLTPFPPQYTLLPRAERREWENRRKAELRAWKEWEKGCKATWKAEEARKRVEEMARKRKEKEDAKIKAREAKLHQRLGYRPLPQLAPKAGPAAAPTPAPAPAPAPTGPIPWQSQPSSWMLLPTLEEFGVRRPFDAPGRPEGLGGKTVEFGGVEWPKMSRTMTHALQDMSSEERIHLGQAGHTWAPATGWYRD